MLRWFGRWPSFLCVINFDNLLQWAGLSLRTAAIFVSCSVVIVLLQGSRWCTTTTPPARGRRSTDCGLSCLATITSWEITETSKCDLILLKLREKWYKFLVKSICYRYIKTQDMSRSLARTGTLYLSRDVLSRQGFGRTWWWGMQQLRDILRTLIMRSGNILT